MRRACFPIHSMSLHRHTTAISSCIRTINRSSENNDSKPDYSLHLLHKPYCLAIFDHRLQYLYSNIQIFQPALTFQNQTVRQQHRARCILAFNTFLSNYAQQLHHILASYSYALRFTKNILRATINEFLSTELLEVLTRCMRFGICRTILVT